ncbi:hypothetical protein [Sulfobacillus thermosulfidooxidans]|uniref:hypothetical protein n=1 Tax=Sulfobacillus thermosulfidooxidans TaxID=28034 RepID=UPI0003147E81|nr:hypothetical protein [Sulfobacillus thermosulfidooxidans]
MRLLPIPEVRGIRRTEVDEAVELWELCWERWDAVCQAHLRTYDLGWAIIRSGRIALTCYMADEIPQIRLDRPLMEILAAHHTLAVVEDWLALALAEWRQHGGVLTWPVPWRWRWARWWKGQKYRIAITR